MSRHILPTIFIVTLAASHPLPAQSTSEPPKATAPALSAAQTATNEKLNRAVKGVQFRGTPLTEVLEKIAKAGDLKFAIVDKDRVHSGKCDIFLENVPLKALLTKALSQNRLDHRVETDGTISIIRKKGPIEWTNEDTAGHDVEDLSERLKGLHASADRLRGMTEEQKNSRVYVDEFMAFMQTRGEVYASPSLTGEPIPESLDVLPPREQALEDWMKGQGEKLEAAQKAAYAAFQKRMAEEEQERQQAAAKDAQPPPAEGGQPPAPAPTAVDPTAPRIHGNIIDGEKRPTD
ncbi:hypothetical protein IT570_12600 [Candidatus Sumerlaeota bacterium]|nr:hypothetical protein [Candidatus Sumerlaeota bacterium]